MLINIVGLNMAAPTILVAWDRRPEEGAHSGLSLRRRTSGVRASVNPGAGSDMANQQTLGGGPTAMNWIINGHKVWTSLGHFAKWMILIARTSKDHKYDGLTYFLMPIKGHPGVTVRPLVKITGESGFNEVLFEDAVVPDSLRLDDVGKGWTVAMTTLTFERGAAESAGGGGGDSGRPVQRLVDLAKHSWRDGGMASDDALIRDAIVERAIVAEGIRQNARRSRVPALCEHPMRLPLATESDFERVLSTECEAGSRDRRGARSTLYKLDEAAPDAGYWPLAYMNSYGHTIAAGTSEIQRNILGERVLGLPKSK